MATIKDVARQAGVSKTLVSRYLNCQSGVGKATSSRIKHAIEELNYRPNALARSLVMRRTYSIGVVIDDMTSPFIVRLIEGMELGVREAQVKEPYTILYTNSCGDLDKKRHQIEYLTRGRVDGIILYGSMVKDDALIRRLHEQHFPLVLVENDMPGVALDKVVIDNAGGAFAATEHLIGLGHRRIAHICGNMNLKITAERMSGYASALQRHGMPVDSDLIIFPRFDDEADWGSERGGHRRMYYTRGYEAMKTLIASQKTPDAAFFATDLSAFGAIRALTEAGLTVPKDVSVIGFDDEISAAPQLDAAPITSMQQPLLQAGYQSVQMLIQRLEHPETPVLQKVLYTTMILRNTTAMRNG